MSFILCLNCGTSSAKYALFKKEDCSAVTSGIVERVGIADSFIRHNVSGKPSLKVKRNCKNHQEAIQLIFEALKGELDPDYRVLSALTDISAVGHRVLHGGEKFVKSALINREVYDTIVEMIELGPLHNPANLAGIDAVTGLVPDMPQIAVFDTAFFQTLPEEAYLYGVPYEWYKKYKVRKYGFHGTSHLYLSKKSAALLGKRPEDTNLITLHIGNGASLTAIKNGVAVEHSMGISPLDGVMMGTRSGTVDPAVIPYICGKEKISVEELVNVQLNKKSGIFGFTGKTDMRDIEQGIAEGDENCILVQKLYCYKIRLFLAAYLGVLDYNVDAIIFAGGVGENDTNVRKEITKGFDSIGLIVDKVKNQKAFKIKEPVDISDSSSRIKTLVVPTDEERVILEDVIGILNKTYDVHTNFTYSFQSNGDKS